MLLWPQQDTSQDVLGEAADTAKWKWDDSARVGADFSVQMAKAHGDSHTAPPSPCRSGVLPFAHRQDWETANLLSFCPPEHRCSQPEWFLLIAMMKSWIVLAFYARLSHAFLKGEDLKRGEKEDFPPKSENQDLTSHPLVHYPEKVQDFSP